MRAPVITEIMQGTGLAEYETRYINVQDPPFRAKGNGLTDDTDAINAAMAAAPVGDTILFPAGIYNFNEMNITKPLVLKGAGIVNRWMVGASATILKHTGAANAINISNAAATDLGGITLEKFELKPAVGGGGVHGISLSNLAAATIHNIQFKDIMIKSFGGSGIYSTGTVFDVMLDRVNTRGNVGDGIKVVAGGGVPSQWRFNNCFLDSQTGVWAANLDGIGFYFIGGTIASWDGHGVWIKGSGCLLGVHIEGVNVPNTIGVKYEGSSGCIISGGKITLWDIGIECGGRAMTLSALDNNNVTQDLIITNGGSREFCVILNKAYDAAGPWKILNNRFTADGIQELIDVSDTLITYSGSGVWDPGNLVDGAGETSAAILAMGAALGDFVLVSAPYDLQGITCNGYVSAGNNVKIRLQNETGGAIDLASGTWNVRVMKK